MKQIFMPLGTRNSERGNILIDMIRRKRNVQTLWHKLYENIQDLSHLHPHRVART